MPPRGLHAAAPADAEELRPARDGPARTSLLSQGGRTPSKLPWTRDSVRFAIWSLGFGILKPASGSSPCPAARYRREGEPPRPGRVRSHVAVARSEIFRPPHRSRRTSRAHEASRRHRSLSQITHVVARRLRPYRDPFGTGRSVQAAPVGKTIRSSACAV